jgi:hypothetical protein
LEITTEDKKEMSEDNPKIKDSTNIKPPPNLAALLTPAELEQIERLAELDPEITRRLARALDRLQLARPYQPLVSRTSNESSSEPEITTPSLTDAERATHEAFVQAELSALLALAGQLSHAYEAQPQAQPDQHFKNHLKAELLKQAQAHKPAPNS